jgi:hypothetical protein
LFRLVVSERAAFGLLVLHGCRDFIAENVTFHIGN